MPSPVHLSICPSVHSSLSPSPRAPLHLGPYPLGHPREVLEEGSVSAPGQPQRGVFFSFQRSLWAPLIPTDDAPLHAWLALPMRQNRVWAARWRRGSSQRSLSQGEGKVTRFLEPSILSAQCLMLSCQAAYFPKMKRRSSFSVSGELTEGEQGGWCLSVAVSTQGLKAQMPYTKFPMSLVQGFW